MNISENLQLLLDTKEAIRQAINTQGGSLESGTPFSAYSQAILDLDTSGGGGGDDPGEPYYSLSLDGTTDYDGSTQAVGGGFETGHTISFYILEDYYTYTPSSVEVTAATLDGYDVMTGVTVTQNSNEITVEFTDDVGEGYVNLVIDGMNFSLNVDVLPQGMYRIEAYERGAFAHYPLMTQFQPDGVDRFQYAEIDIYSHGTDKMNSESPATTITIDYDTRDPIPAASTTGDLGFGVPYLDSNNDIQQDENDVWYAIITAPDAGVWYFYNDVDDVEQLQSPDDPGEEEPGEEEGGDE